MLALALIFDVFIGLAYYVPTIATWHTPLLPIEILGFSLVGGAALGSAILAKAGGIEEKPLAKRAILACSVVGAVLAVCGVALHAASASGMSNALFAGADIVSETMPFLIVGALLLVVSCVEVVRGCIGRLTFATGVRACIEALIGILALRVAFYALYLSVGVTIFN